MLNRSFNKNIAITAASCLVLALLFFVFPAQAQAHTLAGKPSFQVSAGFETHYRDGNWVPVQVTLRNDGPDFNGTLSLTASNPRYLGQSNPGTSSSYQAAISLANGAHKQITLYLPLYFDVQSITVRLLDSNGHVVGSQAATLNPLTPGDVLIGVLSDQSSGFGPLSAVPLPNQGGSVILEFLNASTMPTMADVLKNFNIIILDNFTTANLSPAQLTALQSWVNQGGSLILVGGPEWHRTLATLPAGLLPVAINGSTSLPAGTSLLPLAGSTTGHKAPAPIQSPVIASSATPPVQQDAGRSEVVLGSGTTPLIVQSYQGQGSILYLAVDPTLEPVLGWQGASSLWQRLLLRGLGDQALPNSNPYPVPGNYSASGQLLLANRMSSLLQAFLPNTIPSPWMLIILLVGYLLILGPVRLLVIRRLKRREWSWRIVLSSIVVFSLLSYGLALEEKGTALLSNTVTIARLSQHGSPAHITTYMGVFVPSQGDYQVHVPGVGLVQPSPDAYTFYQGGPIGTMDTSSASVAFAQDGTNVNLQNVNIWTLHTILSEQDRQLHSGLESHLALQNGALVGTVTNTLGYDLSDVYMLMPGNALSLGYLAAGQTKNVQLKLSSVPLSPGQTLADLIAQANDFLGSSNTFPYGASFQQPRNELQRHLSILLTLDGKGYYGVSFPCGGPCNPSLPILPLPGLTNLFSGSSQVASSSALLTIVPASGSPFNGTGDSDPLLVPGSPVTLIGWAANPLDSTNSVTINASSPTGLHETLVQIPLGVNLSGVLNLPSNYIAGHLVDVEGNNMQVQFPGAYSMSTGSMTFEYVAPTGPNLQISGLTIAEPTNIGPFNQGGSASGLPFSLYNWHTHAWDAIPLGPSNFTTSDVSGYIGPGGRILLQIANQDSTIGTFTFIKPTLTLQGTASG